MSKDIELLKFTRKYVGTSNWELIKQTTQEELNLFKSKFKSEDKSCIVIGNPSMLNKFKAFFLTRCIKDRPNYEQYSIYEYATNLSSGIKDDDNFVDYDLLFLYRHEHLFTLGNSETWLIETILNKVADRNREGLVTVILSEVRMPTLEKSGEFDVINLSGAKAVQKKKEALESFSNKKDVIATDNTTFYG